MPLVLGGALIAGGSIASGLIGANAAKSAANTQANAAANALAYQQKVSAPFINVGQGAVTTLGQLYGINASDGSQSNANVDYSQFYNSPDYNFAQQQGELGLTRALNARGMNLSGGALKDITEFNQGLATQQFGNYYNRLLSLSQMGQQAASSSGQTIGNTMMAQGQAQASGTIGAANAISGGINSGITNSLLYNALNRSSYAPSGSTVSSTPLSWNSNIVQGMG